MARYRARMRRFDAWSKAEDALLVCYEVPEEDPNG